MKKIIMLCSILSIAFASCITTFETKTFKSNYDYLMDGKKNGELVKKYPLYFSENEIKGSYSVISINRWVPLIFKKKKWKRYLLQKAVFSVQDQKGDAAIIINEYSWKVIKMNK